MLPVAVIGAGPSGVACAIWLKRLGMSPHVFERARLGGQLHDITLPLSDVPGFTSVEAPQLIGHLQDQLRALGIPLDEGVDVREYHRTEKVLVLADGGRVPISQAVYAPGLRVRALHIPGRQWIESRSTSALLLSTLGTAPILIVGGGDRAFEAALRLSARGHAVVLIHRRHHFRARAAFQQKVRDQGVVIYPDTQLQALERGDGFLTAVLNEGGVERSLRVHAVMVRIGMEPDLYQDLCPQAASDVVPLWPSPMVRMIGDVVLPVPFRSVVTAFASGMTAAKELVMLHNGRALNA